MYIFDVEWCAVNNYVPFFSLCDYDLTESFEEYAELDSLKRCGVCIANIGVDLMPLPGESRQSISSVYPTGWKYNDKSNNNRYNNEIVPACYIYNRCHLIGYQLTAENANKRNLVTGTRQLNMTMLTFENMIADYLNAWKTDSDPSNDSWHILYRVTPVFVGDELLCRGLLLEAESVEDNGESLLFCVFVYNAQKYITINYLTGENYLPDTYAKMFMGEK